MSDLAALNCEPDNAQSQALTPAEYERLHQQIPDWGLLAGGSEPILRKTYTFKNFAQALDFTNKVGGLAEQQNHHPALLTEWGKVTVSWWTHKVHGLHRNDFIMAAKTDALYPGQVS